MLVLVFEMYMSSSFGRVQLVGRGNTHALAKQKKNRRNGGIRERKGEKKGENGGDKRCIGKRGAGKVGETV